MTKVCKRLELKVKHDKLIKLRGYCFLLMNYYNIQRNHKMTLIMENRFERIKFMIDEVMLKLKPLEEERLKELRMKPATVVHSTAAPSEYLMNNYENWCH